ncbi:hypothetical protein MMPV_004127 [Pyropia vietnamensis]
MRTARKTVFAAAAAAVITTTAVMSAGVVAGIDKACHHVPIHRVLAAPGGVYNLDDGRQLRARRVDVGGCTTMAALATGAAYPDAASNYTVMSHQSDQCVTGTERDTEQPTYKGFQAVLVEANGFKFTADLVLEDIDAQVVQDPSTGWRETMSSLGVADGQLVAPSFRVTPDALVGISKFRMPATALKEVGFPAGNDLLIDGAAYNSWVHTKNCPFRNDPEGQCKAYVSYPVAVDKLLVIYAITQKSANDPNAAAFFSEVTLSCGCQCLGRPAKYPSVFPDGVTPGKCVSRMSTKPAYGCDFMGKHWCETVDASKWVMTDAATGW